MTVFQSFFDIFKKNSELEWMYDMDFVSDTSSRAYLKKMAIDSCLNFVGRTISQSEFRYKEKDKGIKNDWYYKLNVRPNTDDSASTFWPTGCPGQQRRDRRAVRDDPGADRGGLRPHSRGAPARHFSGQP